jgi:putative spermidine/putrescine transport system substrate-binding protein
MNYLLNMLALRKRPAPANSYHSLPGAPRQHHVFPTLQHWRTLRCWLQLHCKPQLSRTLQPACCRSKVERRNYAHFVGQTLVCPDWRSHASGQTKVCPTSAHSTSLLSWPQLLCWLQLSYWLILASVFTSLVGCTSQPVISLSSEQFATQRWDEVLGRARGTTVNFSAWAGDEARNRFYQSTVADTLQRQYGITLRMLPNSDAAEVVNKLLNEKNAGKASGGSIDLVWINGENFRTAKQAALLWGPFAEQLPHINFFDEQARQRDFGTPIEGYEAPYQKAQFVLAYDSTRVSEPPSDIEQLRAWIKAHPGRFSYPAPPDFTGSVFIRHVLLHFGGGAAAFQNGFDEALYQRAAAQALAYLNEIKPYLWRQGETYPSSPKEADRLFANHELDFTMSYNPSFASERLARGEYPPTTRTFVFSSGTLGNYSYLAIPFNASNVPGALAVINHLMSATHAIQQSQALGSLFPLQLDRLSPAERAAVEALPRGVATLPLAELAAHQLPEPDAAYLERLEKDWQAKVLRP